MLNYTEKGPYLHSVIFDAGYSLAQEDSVWVARNLRGETSPVIDAAVQLIIDNFDPLPYAQAEASEKVKEASKNARARYVTGGAGKDAEYTFKAAEAKQFTVDGTVGTFMQGRMNLTGETAQAIADEWSAKAGQWQQLGAMIAGIEDKASADIKAATDWSLVAGIAQGYIDQLDAI